MHKFNFALLALIFTANFSFAQRDVEKKWTFGIKTGINISNLTHNERLTNVVKFPNNQPFEPYLRVSALLGISADYVLGPRIALSGELLFNTRGTSFRQENNSVITIGEQGVEQSYNYFKVNIDYIEVPISVSYRFTKESDRLFNGYLGVAPGYAVLTETKMHYPEVTAGPGQSTPSQTTSLSNVEKINVSLFGGMQAGLYEWSGGKFYVDLRGSYGLIPVFEEQAGVATDMKLMTGTLGFGIKF